MLPQLQKSFSFPHCNTTGATYVRWNHVSHKSLLCKAAGHLLHHNPLVLKLINIVLFSSSFFFFWFRGQPIPPRLNYFCAFFFFSTTKCQIIIVPNSYFYHSHNCLLYLWESKISHLYSPLPRC